MPTPAQGVTDIVNVNSDAFLKLSKIAFSSIEKLTALNLNVTRTALEDNVARSSALLISKDMKEQTQIATAGASAKTAEVYFKQVQDIATETQKEVSHLLSTYLSPGQDGALPSADWLKGFDLFKAFAQQLTAMTAASTKMVGEATAQVESAQGHKAK